VSLERFGEDRPALAVDLQHLARAVKRRRKLLALLRIGRKARDQRLDLLEQRIAAGVERGPVERRIAIEALEAVAREPRGDRRRDPPRAFGIGAKRVGGQEAVHAVPGPPPRVASALLRREPQVPAPPLRGRSWTPHRRMGHYGLSWDRLGVNQPRARP